jgi:tripartite-type tricarboxylate transporter receptor subunit TctC
MTTTTTTWRLKATPVLTALLCLGSVSTFAPTAAAPGTWPGKQPIKLVAVFPPGGSVDQVARILSQPLAQQLEQTATPSRWSLTRTPSTPA